MSVVFKKQLEFDWIYLLLPLNIDGNVEFMMDLMKSNNLCNPGYSLQKA